MSDITSAAQVRRRRGGRGHWRVEGIGPLYGLLGEIGSAVRRMAAGG